MSTKAELMRELLEEIEEIAPKISDWKPIDQREGWTIYTGTSSEWHLVAALQDDGKYGDGAGTKGPTVVHFTPELALEVGKIAAKHVKENKS